MKINLNHLIYGKIKIGRKVIDFYNFKIRDELSSDLIKKYALECAEKIKSNPRFKDERSKSILGSFYKDLSENIHFLATQPELFDSARIYYNPKKPDLPKAVITIPSDKGPAEAKISTYHETIHYFLKNYDPELTWNEDLVDSMVDFYLKDDKDALFEHRWLDYSLKPKMKIARLAISWLVGALVAFGIGRGHPEISLASFFGSIYGYKLLKRMKKKSLLS